MLKNLDRWIGNVVTFFVIAAYFELFKFMMIPVAVRMLSQVLAIGIMVLLMILKRIYEPGKMIKMNFSTTVLILILGALPSYIVAYAFHDQSFGVSAFANRIIWFYLLYFFVHVYGISVKYVIRMILFVGMFAVLMYYMQFTLYPRLILDINVIEGRGTIRLFVAGMLCTQVAYFYFLNRFLENNKFLDLIMSLLALSIYILQGTRTLIFAIVFLSLLNLFFSSRVKGRIVKIGLVTIASFAVFLIFREIFSELFRVSNSQISDLGGGIRLKAANFFLGRFMPSEWAYLFGNSNAAIGSAYSQRMTFYSIRHGFYITDIGIAGDFFKYGIIFVIAGVVMLVKSLAMKVSPEYRYLKYYILMQCFTLPVGYGILGGVDVILLLILYVFDVDRARQRDPAAQLEISTA